MNGKGKEEGRSKYYRGKKPSHVSPNTYSQKLSASRRCRINRGSLHSPPEGRAIPGEIKGRGTSRCAIKGRNHGDYCRPGSKPTIDLFGRGAISKLSGVMGSPSSPRDRFCVFRAVKGGNTIVPFTSYPPVDQVEIPPGGRGSSEFKSARSVFAG